jgi:hypothetical protein
MTASFTFGYGVADPAPIDWDVIAADPANFSNQQLYSGTIGVPEPSSLAILLAGMVLWAGGATRRKSSRSLQSRYPEPPSA